MKLIAQVKLQPTEEQRSALVDTLEKANAACNYISKVAWETGTFRQYDLHRALYYDVRQRFGLSAQITIRMEAKVSDAYKLDHRHKRVFLKHGAITYDERILSWNVREQTVNIWTTGGRQRMSFLAGQQQLSLLEHRQGQADLILRDSKWYLHQICEITETPEFDPTEWLGIDLGIVNIATTSDGESYAGNHLNGLRKRHARLRKKLQAKGTQAARRLLKKRRHKEQRMARHVNHVISKRIVEKAQRHSLGIALEDLTGIRERTTVRKSQRRQHNSWAFYDLRQKIEYKAKIAGVPMLLVDPRNTSRTCPVCGCIDKRNRLTQELFSCVSCGHSASADTNAAIVIGRRAAHKPAILPGCAVNRVAPGESSLL